MIFFRKRRTIPKITILDHVALGERLQAFEDEYASTFGERISSAEFYDVYRAGGADEIPDAIAWASYYEMYRAQGRRELESSFERSSRPMAAV